MDPVVQLKVAAPMVPQCDSYWEEPHLARYVTRLRRCYKCSWQIVDVPDFTCARCQLRFHRVVVKASCPLQNIGSRLRIQAGVQDTKRGGAKVGGMLGF